jgi:hypothetical protein
MSATGNPVEIVWAIQEKPQDSTSLFALPVDGRQLGVLVFTQRKYAEEFACDSPDIPDSAIIVRVELPDLKEIGVRSFFPC